VSGTFRKVEPTEGALPLRGNAKKRVTRLRTVSFVVKERTCRFGFLAGGNRPGGAMNRESTVMRDPLRRRKNSKKSKKEQTQAQNTKKPSRVGTGPETGKGARLEERRRDRGSMRNRHLSQRKRTEKTHRGAGHVAKKQTWEKKIYARNLC